MADAALANATDNDNVTGLGGILPTDPFRSLFVHFGMLLGVEDFRTLDAYHRGKMWYHTGWLHRQGVIWGLGVSIDLERNEVRVEPGAAIDRLGRELYLPQAACLNLNAWYNQHKDDPKLLDIIEIDEDTGEASFDAHVTIQFKACLNRQVPALTEPCDGSNATTAYSRVVETVDLHLLPGNAPQWRAKAGDLPFHRVRLLFGLEEAMLDTEGAVTDDDKEVLDARTAILALATEEQPAAFLKWLRYFSALDEMIVTPAKVDEGETFFIFPAKDPDPIPLADLLALHLEPTESGLKITQGGVDNTIRPVHLPTSTIQELVCGPSLATIAGGGAPPAPVPAPVLSDAGGPRIDLDSLTIAGEQIQFTVVGGPLMKASVDARGISVSAFDNRDGWVSAEIREVNYDPGSNQVTIDLRDAPGGNLVRTIVRGTGEYPFLGRNRIPLAGSTESGPGNQLNGNDFVSMKRNRS